MKFSPEHLAMLIELVDAGTINSSVAKEVFEHIFHEDVDPKEYVEESSRYTVMALRTWSTNKTQLHLMEKWISL